MKKTATIKHVAERAGVATATVARVLHNNGYVAKATQEKVLKAVQETGYSINSIARSLKRSRSNVIGHVLQSTIPNPFFAKVASGVEEYSLSHGYTTLTYNVHGEASAEKRGVETFLGWRADAIIFTTPLDAKNVEYASKANIPVVQIERPRNALTDRIVVDNYSGAVAAVEHLLALRHKHIAYIGQRPGSLGNEFADYVEQERLAAYTDVLTQEGLYDNSLVSFGEAYRLDVSTAKGHGYNALKQWLADGKVPTAVFASNDILAAGALQAIYERGLRVPDDISVIGFDDTLATFLSPLLTTVRLPAKELGVAAAKLAIARLDSQNENSPVTEIKLQTELIVRNSTGPAQ